MDHVDLQEIRKVLHNHEEQIQCNRTSLFSATAKVHNNEHWDISQFTSIMGTLVQHKQHIATLEAKCGILRNMFIKISKGTQSRTSNQRMSYNSTYGELKEEDGVHHLVEDMEIRQQGSIPSNFGLEEAIDHQAFH